MGNCFGRNVAPDVPARDYVETEDTKEIQNKIERETVVREPFTEFTIFKMAIEKSITDSRWYRAKLLMVNEEGECS